MENITAPLLQHVRSAAERAGPSLWATSLPHHWSALVRAECRLAVPMRAQQERWRRRWKEGRAAVGVEREEVSISAVPAAIHLPLPVTSYYFDTNTTCAVEYDLHKRVGGGFHFQFYSRNGRQAGNYMQMKTVSIKHDPCVCVWSSNDIPSPWLSFSALLFSTEHLRPVCLVIIMKENILGAWLVFFFKKKK